MRAFLACFLALAACSSDSGNTIRPAPAGRRYAAGRQRHAAADHGPVAAAGLRRHRVDRRHPPESRRDRGDEGLGRPVVRPRAGGHGRGCGRRPGLGQRLAVGSLAGLAFSLAFECHDAAHVVIPCNGAEDHVRVVVKYSGATSGANMSMDGINEKGVFYVRYVNMARPMFGGTGPNAFTSTLSTGVYTVSYQESSAHLLFDSVTPVAAGVRYLRPTLTMHRRAKASRIATSTSARHLAVTGADAAVAHARQPGGLQPHVVDGRGGSSVAAQHARRSGPSAPSASAACTRSCARGR